VPQYLQLLAVAVVVLAGTLDCPEHPEVVVVLKALDVVQIILEGVDRLVEGFPE
jgi:hypothetical protein